MKKIKIQNYLFNEAMKVIKNNLSKDNYRPVLKKVKCDISNEYINFISLNGYSGTIFKIKHNKDVTPFSFVFDWFKVESDKTGVLYMTFEQDIETGETKCIYQDLNENKIIKIFNQPNQEYFNYEDLFYNATKNISHSIMFGNAQITNTLKSHAENVKIYFSDNPVNPILLNSKTRSGNEIESIVLPMKEF